MCYKNSDFLFVVGVQKCGTSTLFNVLSRHNKVIPSKIKEPQFLALPKDTIRRNFNWYETLFSGEGSTFLDGSTFYYYSERAWKNIQLFFEDPVIIVIIRDPIKRAFSAHKHMFKKIPARDSRTFENILRSVEFRKNGKGIERIENILIQEAVESGKIDSKYLNKDYLRRKYDVQFDSEFENPLWPYRYLSLSKYKSRIKKIKETFGHERVKTVVLENLVDSPKKVTRGIFRFIGLDTKFVEGMKLPHKHKTKLPRGAISRTLLYIKRKNKWVEKTWNYAKSNTKNLPRYLKNILQKPKPKLRKEEYKRGRTLLEEEYKYWEYKLEDKKNTWGYE